MWKIPVGRFFEALIDWLKDNAQFVFGAIDAVLGFSIRALEQVFLLNHAALYPSMIVSLLAAVLLWLLARGRGPRTGALAALGGLVLVGGLETWRYRTLEATLDPGEASAVAAELRTFAEAMESAAPEDYGAVQGLLDEGESFAADDTAFVRNLGRIERRLERLRPGEHGRAADLVVDLRTLLGEARWELEVPASFDRQLDQTETLFRALAGIGESEQLATRFDRVDEPVRRHEFLNRRSYRNTIAFLDASIEQAETLGIASATLGEWRTLQAQLGTLNPGTLSIYPAILMAILLSGVALVTGGTGLAVFSVFGFCLIILMGYWVATMETLALVIAATFFALLVGVPAGIWSARNAIVNRLIRPLLDFMQTMPAFVYLIPAVLFFGLGRVPGAIATLIFAMPPAVRLTSLGIRQVPKEVVEAAQAFGATPAQLLFKAQLPIALPTILAGLNQTIMLALSMVVIGGMIGAGGLGEVVLSGITQMKIDVGFESGIAVVILAVFLDRITQSIGGTAPREEPS